MERVSRITRQSLVKNARENFQQNITNLYKENATAPVLAPAPEPKKAAPPKPVFAKSASMQRQQKEVRPSRQNSASKHVPTKP